MKRNSIDSAIVIIVELLKILQSEETQDHYRIEKKGSKYLLSQTLRQLNLPESRYYISEKAYEKWKEISDKNIFDYYYQSRVTNEFKDLTLPLYVGASKNSMGDRTIKKGATFTFRQVFHDDHIIPIKQIIIKLMELKTPNYDNVMPILKRIGICRMLKKEDRSIKNKSKRPFDEEKIINTIYQDSGITIMRYRVESSE